MEEIYIFQVQKKPMNVMKDFKKTIMKFKYNKMMKFKKKIIKLKNN